MSLLSMSAENQEFPARRRDDWLHESTSSARKAVGSRADQSVDAAVQNGPHCAVDDSSARGLFLEAELKLTFENCEELLVL